LDNAGCYSVTSNDVVVYVNTGSLIASNALVTDVSAQITWAPYSPNATYNISWTGGSATNVSSPYTITGLASGSLINVTVTQTVPSCGVTGNTSFTTMCAAPTGLALTSPTTYGFTATWNPVPGATDYQLYYRIMGGNVPWNSLTVSGATTYTFPMPNLSPNTPYSVYVVALGCTSGSYPSAVQTITTGTAYCTGPTSILATSTCSNQINISVTGAATQVNYIMRRIYPTVSAWFGYTVSSSSYTVTLPGSQSGNEQYEVYARNVCGTNQWSSATNIVTVTTPARLAAPTNVLSSLPTCTGFTISWTGVAGATNGYQVVYRKVGNTAWSGYAVPAGTTVWTFNTLGAGSGSYEVYVVAKGCNNLWGAQSTTITTATLIGCRGNAPAPVAQEVTPGSENETLKVFPNPNDGQFSVTMTLNNDNAATLEVLNVLGQVVYNTVPEVSNGQLSTTINMKNQAAGIYYVRIKQDGVEYLKKVMIAD
jgi:hypothetical protein